MIEAIQRLWLRLTGWRCLGRRPFSAHPVLVSRLGYAAAVTEAAKAAATDIDRMAIKPDGQPRPGYRTYVQKDGYELVLSLWRNGRQAQRSL